MKYQELAKKIDSPTLQRDLEYFNRTGEWSAGYTPEERELMEEYLSQ